MIESRCTSKPLLFSAFLVALVALSSGACAGPDELVTSAQGLAAWNPGATLVQQHADWHNLPCTTSGQPLLGQVGVGRRCTGRGEDFLLWHHNYLERLRDEYERQGLGDDISAWYGLPAAMTTPANGWTPALEAAHTNILTFTDPATGGRFASLDDYGTYIETFYQAALRGIAATIYGDTNIGSEATAPKSTLFFGIYGFIDWHLNRFTKGDFNWDGKTDLVIRNKRTGADRLQLMDGEVMGLSLALPNVGINACKWYIGAIGDFNFDGHPDLVWHGPGCASTAIWLMQGRTLVENIPFVNVPAGWTLVGAADVNNDLRPDLVWRNDTTSDIDEMVMNGTALVREQWLTAPPTWRLTGVADITDNGPPDLIFSRLGAGGAKEFAVQYLTMGGFPTTSEFVITGITGSPYAEIVGAGGFHGPAPAADFAINTVLPTNVSTLSFARLTSFGFGFPGYTMSPSITLPVNEVVQGPR